MDQGKDSEFKRLGEESTEPRTQEIREADKFRYFAPEGQVPPDPRSEIDELYSKDEKVPHIDLSVFAEEHQKSLEDQKFNEEMERLKPELDKLEEGKLTLLTLHAAEPPVRPRLAFSHSIPRMQK